MQRVRQMLAMLVLVCVTLGTAPAGVRGGSDLMPRSIDPHLWRLVKEKPMGKIPVIIRLRGTVADPAQLLRPFGGRVNQRLHFIDSVRAELPAAAVALLGENPAVQFVTADTPVKLLAVDTSNLQTIYNQVVGSPPVWNTEGLTGSGVGVAVLDTGANPHDDLKDHLTVINTNQKAVNGGDSNGHGTHVAGIIGGRAVSGRYYGVAPDAQVISVKVVDEHGMSTEGDLLRGMQWIYDNRSKYNIRVVNISLTGTVENSYLTSPLDAGVEQLWRAGIFVVVAAGNRGDAANAVRFPPANDGFALTVGALDDGGTEQAGDDLLAYFSSRGTTQDNLVKPDLVAPGRNVVSTLAGSGASLAAQAPARVVEQKYLRLSGTSMASPVVAGAAALILQRYPTLTPDQLKWLFVNSANSYAGQPAGTAAALDLQAALALAGSESPGSANQGLAWNTSVDPTADSATWNSTFWESTFWESAYAEPAAYEYLD